MTVESLNRRTMIHATCLDIAGRGVLLRGVSGSGKSDLALRLIDQGASLVADDQVWITARGSMLMAHAPATIRNKIEVRGVGILSCPTVSTTRLVFVVDLAQSPVERYPDQEYTDLLSFRLPRLRLYPFHASAPVKLRWALDSKCPRVESKGVDSPGAESKGLVDSPRVESKGVESLAIRGAS